jgi:hypothetical protein
MPMPAQVCLSRHACYMHIPYYASACIVCAHSGGSAGMPDCPTCLSQGGHAVAWCSTLPALRMSLTHSAVCTCSSRCSCRWASCGHTTRCGRQTSCCGLCARCAGAPVQMQSCLCASQVGHDLPVNGIRAAYAFSQIFALLASLYAWSRAEATASTTETITAKLKQATGP